MKVRCFSWKIFLDVNTKVYTESLRVRVVGSWLYHVHTPKYVTLTVTEENWDACL